MSDATNGALVRNWNMQVAKDHFENNILPRRKVKKIRKNWETIKDHIPVSIQDDDRGELYSGKLFSLDEIP